MNKTTVTIGIPAFNEGNNIGCLLSDLIKQRHQNYLLKNIIVSSDGSSDNTVLIAKAIKYNKLKVINNQDRKGVAIRQNQIISQTNSDILVLLNADIRILDPDFIAKLIQPIIDGKADLTSPFVRELSPRTFIESALNNAMKIKTVIFETWKYGHNGYMCHGTARAFSKNLYKKLRFTVNVGEDMYSYLECLRLGNVFRYVKTAEIWYRNPDNITDQLKQSTRFIKYHTDFLALEKYSPFYKELRIPFFVYLLSFVKSLPIIILNPLKTLTYIFISIYMRYRILYKPYKKDLWITKSTKTPW